MGVSLGASSILRAAASLLNSEAWLSQGSIRTGRAVPGFIFDGRDA
jgi:hypothetical protein